LHREDSVDNYNKLLKVCEHRRLPCRLDSTVATLFMVLCDLFHRVALGVELPSLPGWEQSSHSVSRLMLHPVGAWTRVYHKLLLSTISQGVICRENSASSLPSSTVMTADSDGELAEEAEIIV